MWKLLSFSHVFMLINGSDALLAVPSLMISRTHCLRKHLGVLLPFPCPAISHYVGNNQKPNPSTLRFCHSPQPLCMEVKIATVLLFSGCPWSPRVHLFPVRGTEGGRDGNERTHEAKCQRCIWRGRQAGNARNLLEEGDQMTDEQYKCFCQLGGEEMTVFSVPEFRRELT